MPTFSYLLDTNVISTKARAGAHPEVSEWLQRNSERLFLSTITIAEITAGIAKLRRTGSVRRASDLAGWLESLLHLYSDRVLPFDVRAARIAGGFADLCQSKGRTTGFADVAIAAIASARGLLLLTHNTADFAAFGIALHDPFLSLPD